MNRFLQLSMLLTSIFLVTGCKEPKQIVKDITLTNYQSEEDHLFVSLDSYVDLGDNLQVPALDLSIKKPGADSVNYGSLRLAPTLDGRVQVTINADLTSIFKLQGGTAGLPNGSQLPIGGVHPRDVIDIPIQGINAHLYVTSKDGIIMVGFAIAIKEFDAVGAYMGANANIFPAFTIKGVRGLAGVFTSAESGKTGLAVFTSFKSVISGGESELLASGAKASELLTVKHFASASNSDEAQMFRSKLPSKLRLMKMERAIKRFRRTGTTLTPVRAE